MVSVITCTMREEFMHNVFHNYHKQAKKMKELIIILNNNKLNIDVWKEYAKKYQNVSIFQMDESYSLGACLNYAVRKAKYDIIARFDDDDYYGAKYLKSSVIEFDRKNVSIIGKRAYYVYLEGKNQLLLVTPKSENKYVKHLAGASLIFKKEVFNLITFNDLNVGEDSDFIKRCKEAGFKIYSTNRHYFAVFRREDTQSHTWKITEKEFRKNAKIIRFSGSFKDKVNNRQRK